MTKYRVYAFDSTHMLLGHVDTEDTDFCTLEEMFRDQRDMVFFPYDHVLVTSVEGELAWTRNEDGVWSTDDDLTPDLMDVLEGGR